MAQVELTQADQGKSIQVKPGDHVVIRLNENATTGFGWAIDQLNPDYVSLVNSDYAPASGTGIGGGGTRNFTFTALKAGTTVIQLKLWRKWEGDSSIRQRFQATIKVQA